MVYDDRSIVRTLGWGLNRVVVSEFQASLERCVWVGRGLRSFNISPSCPHLGLLPLAPSPWQLSGVATAGEGKGPACLLNTEPRATAHGPQPTKSKLTVGTTALVRGARGAIDSNCLTRMPGENRKAGGNTPL